MKTENVSIRNEGHITCRSNFYMCEDTLDNEIFDFSCGVNILKGEIDSHIWSIGYLMSMYKYRPNDFVIFEPANIKINGEEMSLVDAGKYICYMDKIYPPFSSKNTIEKIIKKAIKKNNLEYTFEEIIELFELDSQRIKRPLFSIGNERFQAMAAIGFCEGKDIYCFPWLSKKRFEYYRIRMELLFDIFEKFGKIAIVPIGK